MRISVAVGALPGYPVARTFEYAARSTADGVELLLSPRLSRRDPGDITRLADAARTRILSIHSILRFSSTPIDAKIRDDTASVRFATGLRDCEVVVLHPPMTGPRPSSDLNRWLAAIVAERDRYRPDLRLALENRPQIHDGSDRQLLDDFAMLRSVAGEWDLDVTLDLAHAASWGTHVLDALANVRPRLANLHLSDARPSTLQGGIRTGLFRDHLLPGEGYLPIDGVLQRLAADGYDGLVTIELSPVSLRAWWPPSARARVRDAVANVREMSQRTPVPHIPRAEHGKTARSHER
jgi:sugar phosphate isomerase/epimerase